MTLHRSLSDLRDYAARLHCADPYCTEVIPVTPEEAFMVQEDILGRSTLTDRNYFNALEMKMQGHRLKIL